MAPVTDKRTSSSAGTPATAGAPQAEIERLYGLPLDRFTPARDELARALRGAGDRDASAEIKQLRKPNLPAWALNQARRRDPERVAELLRAGARLQEAQQRAVAGGGRGVLPEAAADERRLVEELVAVAERELTAAGHPVNATVQSKLWATAHAAAVTDEPGGLLSAGRLVRDYQISDLGLTGAAAPAAELQTPARREAGGPASVSAARPRRAAASEAVGGRDTARTDPAERKAAAREATQRAAAERRAAAKAAAERAAAERRARGLRRQLDRARARVRQLETALEELEP